MIRFPISRNHDSKHPEWWFPIPRMLALSTGSVALKVRTDGSIGAGILRTLRIIYPNPIFPFYSGIINA